MRLARFRQQPAERKNYLIKYDAWLEAGEAVDTVATSVTPAGAMTITGVAKLPGDTQVIFSIGGGEDAVEYKATFTITTSDGQTKQDEILYAVDEI